LTFIGCKQTETDKRNISIDILDTLLDLSYFISSFSLTNLTVIYYFREMNKKLEELPKTEIITSAEDIILFHSCTQV